MQKEMISNLELTIAKLELKQLEVIDKLSDKHDDYVIRCITCLDTSKLLAVNGDWEKVTGFKETVCVGVPLDEFITRQSNSSTKSDDGFINYNSDMITKDGTSINVEWKSKHFSNIDATVSIGRVKK